MPSRWGSLRVLHTADLHLGRSFRSWGAGIARVRQSDLLETMEQIGEHARRHDVALLLIAGDLFDAHNPPSTLIARVHGWLDRLDRDGIQVAVIPGNHDSYWYEQSVYREHLFPTNTHIFTTPTCEEPFTLRLGGIDVHLYGIAHDHTQERQPMPTLHRRAVDGLHIGMLHGTVDPPPSLSIADRYLPMTSADLAGTELDYVALGHIHRYRTFNDGRPGFACQPGSPEPLALDEDGPRSVTLLTFDGGPARIERLPVGRREVARQVIDCTGLDRVEIGQRLAELADAGRILQATLTGAPDEPPVIDDLREEASPGFCYLALVDQTTAVDAAFARRVEAEQTIRGRFVRTLRQRAATAVDDEERAAIDLALKLGLIALERRSAR